MCVCVFYLSEEFVNYTFLYLVVLLAVILVASCLEDFHFELSCLYVAGKFYLVKLAFYYSHAFPFTFVSFVYFEIAKN